MLLIEDCGCTYDLAIIWRGGSWGFQLSDIWWHAIIQCLDGASLIIVIIIEQNIYIYIYVCVCVVLGLY